MNLKGHFIANQLETTKTHLLRCNSYQKLNRLIYGKGTFGFMNNEHDLRCMCTTGKSSNLLNKAKNILAYSSAFFKIMKAEKDTLEVKIQKR